MRGYPGINSYPGCIQGYTLSSLGHGVAQAELVLASAQFYLPKASFLK
ncbi:MAG: hypothetical protein UW75_C0039G0001 [Parcubacteria group bacterium GW2011_GWF2_44_8]|nr:MAG: hypothetical protein UW75_C0039G0001 [Parcubacteria group bacterium GW2011_GWF2_44_8]